MGSLLETVNKSWFHIVAENESIGDFWILRNSTRGGTVDNHTSLHHLFSLLHTTIATEGIVPTDLRKCLEQALRKQSVLPTLLISWAISHQR